MLSNKSKQFVNTVHRFKKLKFHDKQLSNITNGEFFLLSNIKQRMEEHNDKKELGVKISDLSKDIGCKMAGVSRMVNGLEEKGLIERKLDAKDRRAVYIDLSEQGQKQYKEATIIMDHYINSITERYGEEDLEVLFVHLNKLFDIMSEEFEKIPDFAKERKEV